MFKNESENQEQEQEQKTFILVDGSYYCFYRYYSLLNWWKNAFPENPIDTQIPIENPIFVEKFKKLFIENLQNIPNKLHLDKNVKPILIVGKDCKRENIWRNELFPKYKGTRIHDEKFMGAPFFKMVYEEKLFEKAGTNNILSLDKLEADDCIAITVNHLLEKYKENCRIFIIASDHDYLQLHGDQVKIYNLAYKNITESKTVVGKADADLEIKIIMGDTSDNIPSVFPKCGFKTALKCYENKEFFEKKMGKNLEYMEQYKLNQQIIDFRNIPKDLKELFIEKNNILFV
jgi:5'-3' exonuclease